MNCNSKDYISCGTFGKVMPTSIFNDSEEKSRLLSKKENRDFISKLTPVATDGEIGIIENTSYSFFDFINIVDKIKIIVLTKKEFDIIVGFNSELAEDIIILELNYPIFNKIKYTSNVLKNYMFLLKSISKLKSYGIKGKSLLDNEVIINRYAIERKLRFKHKLDAAFYFHCSTGYQDIFKFTEDDKERLVIALDFNSMYSSCMRGEFIDPKSIKYRCLTNELVDCKNPLFGMYIAVFSKPKKSFFERFHPFKIHSGGKQSSFNFEHNTSIEVLVYHDELSYYSQFFNKTKVKGSFYSDKTIAHPLLKKSETLYKQRIHFKSQGNIELEQLTKMKLATLHSTTNPRRNKTKHFTSLQQLKIFLIEHFGIDCLQHYTDNETLAYIRENSKFNLLVSSKSFSLQYPNIYNSESIYSLTSRVLANSKLKMLKTIDLFLKFKSVEICYTNIDSIHLSINKSDLDNFLLSFKHLISEEMGGLRVQSISSHGYWFDIGRYWLVDNGTITKYKNISFNNPHSNRFFDTTKSMNPVFISDEYNYTVSRITSIYNSFSYIRKLNNNVFSRYELNEVKNIMNFNKSYNREIFNSKKIKVELFNKLMIKYEKTTYNGLKPLR
ncbi:hypothetical protein [Shewanella colwelliana]|uniref:hypothetical protein n=1 Tax=Shewanella colwelliana TaxID=23 RepID=UPI00048F9103|nr:hypothetical protein [Shewanella colwelliana]